MGHMVKGQGAEEGCRCPPPQSIIWGQGMWSGQLSVRQGGAEGEDRGASGECALGLSQSP